jgi:hypothetical protein
MRMPKTPVDPPTVANSNRPPGLRQQELALVGRLEHLRQHEGEQDDPARGSAAR